MPNNWKSKLAIAAGVLGSLFTLVVQPFLDGQAISWVTFGAALAGIVGGLVHPSPVAPCADGKYGLGHPSLDGK